LNENLEIPTSWFQLALGEVVNYGKTDKVEPNNIPAEAWVLELEDIEKDTSKLLQRLSFSQRQSKSTKNRFTQGDVLYGKLRPYLNKVLVADRDGYCSTEILPLKSNQAINGRFLFYWLKHPEFLDYVESVSHGLNMPRLGTEAGKQASLVLAPLNEQKRIADKLDALLARVDACRERLDRVPLILKRFRQAVLAAATSGQLTEEWREEQECCWSIASVQEVADAIFDGPFGSHLKSDDYTSTGVRVVRLENIGHLRFISEKETYVSVQKYEFLQRHTLSPNDILFSSFVDEEVRVCLFLKGEGVSINKADCFCIRTNVDVCLPEFLVLRLACNSTYVFMQDFVHGATRPRINLKQLKQFEFELPPIDEQKEIVRRVETLFTFANRLEARYKKARSQVEQLTPALLAKAFCGELVPQDPNDEPASMLLERIRAARVIAEEDGTKPRRRKTDKSSKTEVIVSKRKDVQPLQSDVLTTRDPLTAEALFSASQLELNIDDSAV
jgi:type I restriction enzyme, S subunit